MNGFSSRRTAFYFLYFDVSTKHGCCLYLRLVFTFASPYKRIIPIFLLFAEIYLKSRQI